MSCRGYVCSSSYPMNLYGRNNGVFITVNGNNVRFKVEESDNGGDGPFTVDVPTDVVIPVIERMCKEMLEGHSKLKN